jgi:hypothetical protein
LCADSSSYSLLFLLSFSFRGQLRPHRLTTSRTKSTCPMGSARKALRAAEARRFSSAPLLMARSGAATYAQARAKSSRTARQGGCRSASPTRRAGIGCGLRVADPDSSVPVMCGSTDRQQRRVVGRLAVGSRQAAGTGTSSASIRPQGACGLSTPGSIRRRRPPRLTGSRNCRSGQTAVEPRGSQQSGSPRRLGSMRHLWWRHAVRDRRSLRRSAETSSEASVERPERPGMHIEAQRRNDPIAQSDSLLGDRSTNDE